jgi:hypothetical protein
MGSVWKKIGQQNAILAESTSDRRSKSIGWEGGWKNKITPPGGEVIE